MCTAIWSLPWHIFIGVSSSPITTSARFTIEGKPENHPVLVDGGLGREKEGRGLVHFLARKSHNPGTSPVVK